MTDQQVLCNLIMNCFTGGIILDSSDVHKMLGTHGIRKVTSALGVLRRDGRLSFKKSGRSFVYWVDVVNIAPKPVPYVLVDNPVISEPVYPTKHHKARAAVHSSWVATLLFYGMAIVIVGLIVN